MFLHTNMSPKWNLAIPVDFDYYSRRWQVTGSALLCSAFNLNAKHPMPPYPPPPPPPTPSFSAVLSYSGLSMSALICCVQANLILLCALLHQCLQDDSHYQGS